MTQLSISQTRKRLTKLPAQLKGHNTIEVTNRGKPVLAVLSWELYEAIEETLEIISDEDLQLDLKKSLHELQEGKLVSWDQVKKEMGLH